jgi:hypothetical protein
MTQSNNDIEELEELLTELEGQEAQLVRPYSEDDDAVTQLMDAPLGDQEWMVQVTALDRRMMSTDQVLAELRAGKLSSRTLVWRGGMDDWLPIARVDSLSQSGAPLGAPAGGASARLMAPAPLPAPPMWSTLPSAAPLSPPPAAMAPQSSPLAATLPSNSAMSVGLPPPPAEPSPSQPGFSRPSSPSLPPAVMAPSAGNTARPVAIDFSDMVEDNTSPLRGKRALMALSAVAILAVFLSVYAFSSKNEGTVSAEQPRAVGALQPSTEKKAEPIAPAKVPEAEAAPAAAKPAESEMAANDTASSGSARTAPARYSPRSEYRRRSRGSSSAAERGSDDSESATESAPEVAARATAPSRATAAPAAEEEAPAAEPAAPAVAAGGADDADAPEPPKSTGRAGSTFNREAARAALNEAASQAKNCRPAGGPSGAGRVEVRYEPSGKVAAVSLLTGKFDNTTTGSCVRMLFRRAKVPEFTGAPVVVVNKSFEIP